MDAFEDPQHEGNGERYLTGKECIEPGCHRPAGTKWSRHWCFECNVTRMKRIDAQLAAMQEQMREMREATERSRRVREDLILSDAEA